MYNSERQYAWPNRRRLKVLHRYISIKLHPAHRIEPWRKRYYPYKTVHRLSRFVCRPHGMAGKINIPTEPRAGAGIRHLLSVPWSRVTHALVTLMFYRITTRVSYVVAELSIVISAVLKTVREPLPENKFRTVYRWKRIGLRCERTNEFTLRGVLFGQKKNYVSLSLCAEYHPFVKSKRSIVPGRDPLCIDIASRSRHV